MGFSLPAAIGASFANRNKDIWVIVGDGSIQMTITELATAVQECANIKIAIIIALNEYKILNNIFLLYLLPLQLCQKYRLKKVSLK